MTTPTRRTVLAAIGAGFAGGLTGIDATGARRSESRYVLVQGDRCEPIRPLRGDAPVEAFYDYQLPPKYVSDANGASAGSDAPYASAGTTDLQRERTSLAFLYRGPEGLSLVVVHGSTHSADAGAVTFRLSGLPEDGRWVVKDDLYRDPDTGERASSNYDRWDVDGTDYRIDWTWGSSGTDGGAFRGLGGDFAVTVDPAFNDAAALFGEHYEGTVTDWEFLSRATDGPDRISLGMDEPIRIETGSCERDDDADEAEREADDAAEEEGEGDEGYLVCHKPPGNPDNARTIRVGSKSALEAHLGHGDTEGPCPGDE